MKTRLLKNAEKQFKLGNYSQVIRILEPEVFGNRDNEYFYFYLGMSCLFLGDYNGANSYLRRSLQINPANSKTLLGLAVIHLKYNKPSEAIRIWLDILDRDPKNRFAKKSLDIIKKSEALERVPEDFLPKNIHRLLPFKKSIIAYRIMRYLIISIIILSFSTGIFFTAKLFLLKFSKNNSILSELTISRNLQEIIGTGEFKIKLEGREIVESFEDAKKLFLDNKDNEARIEINRLLNSNASESVKEKARLLSGYLREPDFRYFKSTIHYKEVAVSPYLYNGCYVKWSGKITNIRIFENSETFDLLIGYESGKILDGIITVTAYFPIILDEEFSYDIIGQLQTENGISMKAVTLRNYIK